MEISLLLSSSTVMGAHVFVVDRFSFPVHRSVGFCGVKNPPSAGFLAGLKGDLLEIRVGDIVFFYQFRIDERPEDRGFRGIYKVTSEPFFDTSDIAWNGYRVLGKCPYCSSNYSEKAGRCRRCQRELPQGHHILPHRVLIQPVEHFERPVDDNTAYIDQTDAGTLWTMIWRKIYGPGRERSISPILPEEGSKLIRLLRRTNPSSSPLPKPTPYPPGTRVPVQVQLGSGPDAPNESVLRAWIMQHIDQNYPVLEKLVGNTSHLEYFGNEILFGIGGDKIDVLLLHKKEGIRYRATYIELKDGPVEEDAVDQAERYAKWVAQLTTANVDPSVSYMEVQPALIGRRLESSGLKRLRQFRTTRLKIEYPGNPCQADVLRPVVLSYRIDAGRISFHEEATSTLML